MSNKETKRKISAGIVGCGGAAQLIHLPVLTRHTDVQVQAICDIDTSKAAVVADKFKVPRVYQDIAEMLQAETLDVVFLLTPTNLHLPMGLMVLDYGVNLFIEKPAAHTGEQAQRIQRKAGEVGKSVMIGMQNRFRPDIIAINRILQGNSLGKLFFFKGEWLQSKHEGDKQPWIFHKNISGGGVVMDLGVQLLDLIWWLIGKPKPKSAKAFSFNINNKLEVEDFCVACVTFENNVSFSMEVSWDYPTTKDRLFIEIVGEKGTGSINPLKLQQYWNGHLVNITPQIREEKSKYFRKGYEYEVYHYIDFLSGKTKQLGSSINDAVQVLRIVDGLYESIKTGKEIVFD